MDLWIWFSLIFHRLNLYLKNHWKVQGNDQRGKHLKWMTPVKERKVVMTQEDTPDLWLFVVKKWCMSPLQSLFPSETLSEGCFCLLLLFVAVSVWNFRISWILLRSDPGSSVIGHIRIINANTSNWAKRGLYLGCDRFSEHFSKNISVWWLSSCMPNFIDKEVQ